MQSNKNLKQLLILEMKRAIEIMEDKEVLKRYSTQERKVYYGETYNHIELDKDVTELIARLKSIRKDSIKLEKTLGGMFQ